MGKESADVLFLLFRKYYHITQEGLKRIEEFKDDWEAILSIYRFVTKEDEGNE